MLVLTNGNNTESWSEIGKNKILALSYCPENSPSTSETKFTREKALEELETLLETGWTIKENDIFTEAEIKEAKGY